MVEQLAKPEQVAPGTTFKYLTSASLQEAVIIQSLLDEHDILNYIQGENAVTMLPLDFGMGSCSVNIYVASERLEEAQKAVQKPPPSESLSEIESLTQEGNRIMWWSYLSFAVIFLGYPLAPFVSTPAIFLPPLLLLLLILLVIFFIFYKTIYRARKWLSSVQEKKLPISTTGVKIALFLAVASLSIAAMTMLIAVAFPRYYYR